MIYPITNNIVINQQKKADHSNVVYHYTTQKGLIGILRNKKIWASNILFMNDEKEYELIFDRAKENLNQVLYGENTGNKEKQWVELLLDSLDKPGGIHVQTPDQPKPTLNEKFQGASVYATSFSKVDDDLAQWRAYGDQTGSFSIGFRVNALRKLSTEPNSFLIECEYGESIQKTWIQEIVQTSISKCYEPEYSEGSKINLDLFENLRVLSPIIKHPSFSSEKEIRHFSFFTKPSKFDVYRHKLKDLRPENPDFREGNIAPIPYISLSLPKDENNLGIESIRVGPTADPELAKHSIVELLASIGIMSGPSLSTSNLTGHIGINDQKWLPVSHSEVPYRAR